MNKRGPLPSRVGLKNYRVGSPMEKVHLDFLGPLSRTEAGNEYIQKFLDCFTKWIECVPLPSYPVKVTTRAAINYFF